MTRNVLLEGLLCVGMFFYSCSSKNVQSTMRSEPELKDYKTYAWLPSGDTLLNDFNKDPELVMSVMDRVDREMLRRGYKMNTKNPDLLILVHTKNNGRIAQKTLPSGYTYYQPGFYETPWFNNYYTGYKTLNSVTGPEVREVEYKEGTMVIDFIDPEKKEIIWRGEGTHSTKKQSKVVKGTVNNVDEIFAEFPC